MTIEQFYQAKSNLKAPENFNFLQQRNWYKLEIDNLKNQLSAEDLKIVNSRQNEWQKKINSSIN